MALYADGDDLLARFDARTIGDLVSDDATRVEPTDLTGHTNVTAALTDASGDVESALVLGQRYSASDLEGLTGNSLGLLKRLTTTIAMVYLLGRRPDYDPDLLEGMDRWARERLESLRKGENIFNIDAAKDGSVPTIDGPTTLDYDDLNLFRDRTRHYFPARRLPNNR